MPSQLDELSRGAEDGWPGLTGLPQGPPTIAPWQGVGGDDPALVEGQEVAEPAPAAVPPPADPTGREPPASGRGRAQYALLGGFVVLLLVAALVAGLTVHRDAAAAPPPTVAPSTTTPSSTVPPPRSSTPPSTTPSPSAPNNNATPGRPTRPGATPGQNGQNGADGQSSPSPSSPSTTVPGGQASPGRPATGTQVFLGVEVTSASSGGAQVETVETGTPAATAGLEVGDVIVAVDGTQVGAAEDLVTALQAHAPGDKVTLTVDDSSGAERSVPVTLGSR